MASDELAHTHQTRASAVTRPILLVGAAAILALFYLFCIAAVALICALIAVELILYVITARILVGYTLLGPMKTLNTVGTALINSLFLGRYVEPGLALAREDAPRLFDLIERVAQTVGVDPPDQVLLRMADDAGVRLRGYRRGRGRCALELGYDLMAVMTEAEIKVVLVHEMTHAQCSPRGLTNSIAKGIRRIAQVAAATDALNADLRARKKWSLTTLAVSRIAHLTGRSASRLSAAFSRHEESMADRASVRACGAESVRSALSRTRRVSRLASEISMRDRLLQLQRTGSFSEWLRAELTPSDEKQVEIEERAAKWEHADDFDSHPPLAQRLADLPAWPDQLPGSQDPAIHLLADPDGLAERLMARFAHVASGFERKDTEQLRNRTRRSAGEHRYSCVQAIAGTIGVAAAICLIVSVIGSIASPGSDPTLLPLMLVSAPVLIICLALCRRYGLRERIPVPVPTYSVFRKPVDPIVRAAAVAPSDEDRDKLAAELPPNLGGSAARARHWADRCYDALRVCDYRTAWCAAELSLTKGRPSLEALMGRAISAAYFGRRADAARAIGAILKNHNLTGTVPWGLAWASDVMDDWERAEGFLLAATKNQPDEATLFCVLAYSQNRRGKTHEALENVRRAVELNPKEAYQRAIMMRMLVDAGRVREAEDQLRILDPLGLDDRQFLHTAIRIELLLDRREEAAARAAEMQQTHPGGQTLRGLGYCYAESDMDTEAEEYFKRASEEGFYPDVLIALARIEFIRKDYEKVRAHLAQAVDLTREAAPGAEKQLDMLSTVCQAFASTGEPVLGCRAREARIDMTGSPLGVKTMTLLVVAPDEQSAWHHVRWLYGAMHPGTSLADSSVTWTDAEADDQPTGPAQPGIYGYRLE